MNHYERLKVAQDAPPEVVRAAYRALAGKLHPDRQASGAPTGPQDEWHEQMAALNAAYETLIDPQLRREYDATLMPWRASASDAAVPTDAGEASGAQAGAARVDLDWVTPEMVATEAVWPPSKRVIVLVGGVSALLTMAIVSLIWHLVSSHQMEQALSDHYAMRPPPMASGASQGDDAVVMSTPFPPQPVEPAQRVRVADGSAQPDREGLSGAALHRPTVEELSRMSDEELLKVLPSLDARAAPAEAPPAMRGYGLAATRHHPLDGKPLSLRSDAKLVDPLAPDAKP